MSTLAYCSAWLVSLPLRVAAFLWCAAGSYTECLSVGKAESPAKVSTAHEAAKTVPTAPEGSVEQQAAKRTTAAVIAAAVSSEQRLLCKLALATSGFLPVFVQEPVVGALGRPVLCLVRRSSDMSL